MENERDQEIRKRPLPRPVSSSSHDSSQSKPTVPLSDTRHGGQNHSRSDLKAGSSHTTYYYDPSFDPSKPAHQSPPSYEDTWPATNSDFPDFATSWPASDLVKEVNINDDEGPSWNRGRSPTSHDIQSWSDPTQGNIDSWVDNKNVPISGRDLREELGWWDPEFQAQNSRPGSGILPTLLAERLHDSDHSLYHVSVTPPDPHQHAPAASTSLLAFPPPTKEEVYESVPHPRALYCRKENAWILLLTRSSLKLPPFVDGYNERHPNTILPDSSRRQPLSDCAYEEGSRSRRNFTHHYHFYPSAVSSLSLDPPFPKSASLPDDNMAHRSSFDSEALLDIYICCQCPIYVLCSHLIPGVIPVKQLEDFARERSEHPLPNQTGSDAAIQAFDTTLKLMENLLWKGETRAVPLAPGKAFVKHVGLSLPAMRVYETLGFQLSNPTPGVPLAQSTDTVLAPPTIRTKQQRARLLRAWLELSAWLFDYKKRFPSPKASSNKSWVSLENMREQYQMEIGAHHSQIERYRLPGHELEYQYPTDAVEFLGFTPRAYSTELLEFAYRAQCRCNPTRTSEYFNALNQLTTILRIAIIPPPIELDTLYTSELDRGRWLPSDLIQAASDLGFGRSNSLKIELEESEDDFVWRAWEHLMTEAWREPDSGGGAGRRKTLTRSLHIIAEARGSSFLKQKAMESNAELTPEKAYATLEVPPEVEEDILITVYKMRVDDQPTSSKRMQDALSVIAKYRDSDRLRIVAETGEDPGHTLQSFRADWPRGLNQLGNTCYLNSLLQYFYTIKDLRQALTLSNLIDDAKLSDDDLKRHRVGGRLVTRKEIVRSRKFVAALANLFWELECSDKPAVTPELELAKLALVTSKDEEEDEQGRNDVATDSSASTDATLVDEPAITGPVYGYSISTSPTSALPTSPSVLGKRQRQTQSILHSDVDHDHGDLDRDGFIMVSKEPSGSSLEAEPGSSIRDVEMTDAANSYKENKPPPLPPRRKTEVNSESVMMFGKQHDVAECMDNCMFQIETALLRFNDVDSTDKGKASIVKRLFYGTIRQRVYHIPPRASGQSTMHEKEDMFSHLPVNVSDEGFDLYDGLSAYFDDTIEFQGSKAKMEVSLVDLPPILQIQLQRVQFNRETLQPYKSHAYVRFGETLYVDRFLDDADPVKRGQSKAIQAELQACRDRIHALTRDKGSFTDSLTITLDFLSRQDAIDLPQVDDELINQLQYENESLKQELINLRSKAAYLKQNLEAIWQDQKQVEYELTSVFVHRDNPDLWFKYNDSEVSQVRKDEVLADTTGSTANPYLLVYARKGMDMVHTVNRLLQL